MSPCLQEFLSGMYDACEFSHPMHALTMGKPCIMHVCLYIAMDGSWLAVFMQAAHATAFWSDAMSRITPALHEFMKI